MDWNMTLTEIAEHAEWDAGGLGNVNWLVMLSFVEMQTPESRSIVGDERINKSFWDI